jgi:hypothetical protein
MASTRRADMFTADGRPSDDDPREHGPRLGDERTTLVESLRRLRLTLEMKCAGLDADAMAWLAEVDLATRFVADAPSLDLTADDAANEHGSGGGLMSLREALVGMIEEYARHMGHADLLRERIDGRLGQ